VRFLIFLAICACFQGVWAQAKPMVAVSDFSAAGIKKSEAALMTSRFQSALARTGSFTVLERAQMESILAEQGFQQSGACDAENCRIQMGRLLGVDYLLAGEVGQIGNRFVVTVRFLDVGTGIMRFTVDGEHDGSIEETFSELMPAMAKAVSRKFEAWQKESGVPAADAGREVPAEPTVETAALKEQPRVTDAAVASVPTEVPADLQNSKGLDLSEWNWLRIGSYTLATLAVGGAIYSHIQSAQKLDDADVAYNEYKQMETGDFDGVWSRYEDLHDQGQKWSLTRNILAGVAAAGFAVAITTHF